MRNRIQPLVYVEGCYRLPGYSGYDSVPGETPANALVRAADFMNAVGKPVLQVITLPPNANQANFPNFAFLYPEN